MRCDAGASSRAPGIGARLASLDFAPPVPPARSAGMDPASRAAGGFMPRFRLGAAAGGVSMATAASAPTAAAPAPAGGDEAPFAREGKAGHLLLDVGALAARAGDRLAPGADVLLEALVAGVTDVLVDGHLRSQRAVLAPISFLAFSQSSRNFLRPMSVRGCFTSEVKTA